VTLGLNVFGGHVTPSYLGLDIFFLPPGVGENFLALGICGRVLINPAVLS
jgi:hypothetical protein